MEEAEAATGALSPGSLVLIVHGVIKDFVDDGVRLRAILSAPQGLAEELYVQTVSEGISTSPATKISTKRMLKIDRRHSPEVALHFVELAIRFKDQSVVGVDVAGDPYAGHFDAASIKALLQATESDIHLGEIEKREAESASMLEVKPDRRDVQD
ncbi:hypothetical protein BDZ88DRAFT_449041 [Geranomyces variabilis]|nr:hypothetical protein BDZ88DRAFT_449041 [Geranomyces variabilis]